jgi:DNA-binding XRE family transcriptional regulator
MMSLEQIRVQLMDRRLSVVAAAIGVHRNTLISIRDGRNTNPSLRTMEALSAYFNLGDAK